MQSFSDEQLIVTYLGGDETAFAFLVQRHLSFVYGVCLRNLRHAADAEDASQEVFVKVWRHIKKFNTKKNFRTWVAEIAKNTCLDMHKTKRPIPLSALHLADDDVVPGAVLTSTTPRASDLVDRSILKRTVSEMVRALSPAYQTILSLYYTEGFNFREISERLGMSIHTVKSQHRRALLQLKKRYAP